MVDIRSEVVGILIAGAPSPGINGVISAVTIEALNQNCTVVGFYEGFKRMKQGISLVTSLGIQDVSNIQDRGGSILRTSRKQVQGAKEVDNCLRVLELHRVRYFITIGGVDTAYSAFQIAAAAKKANVKLSVCHIPKTIFNDLPLPDGARSFGFSTAREVGMRLVSNFQKDSASMLRWYVLVVMGQKAGHLSLGIGKAAAATITCIPEEFKDKKVTFNMLCDLVEGSMYKRRALGKEYGIAILAEGLVDLMDKKEIEERWKDADNGHQDVGRDIVRVLMDRFKAKNIDATVVSRHIGNELRAADPNSDDIELTRDLGFGAVRFLLEGGSNAMVSTKGDSIVAIPFEDIMDPKTGNTIVREVDTNSILYQVAQSYMIKLYKSDLEDAEFLSKLAKTAEMTPQEFKKRFEYVAWADNPTQYPATLDMMSMNGWGDRVEEHKKKHAPVIVLERKPQALDKNKLAVPASNATAAPQSPNTVLNEVSTYPKMKQTTSGD